MYLPCKGCTSGYRGGEGAIFLVISQQTNHHFHNQFQNQLIIFPLMDILFFNMCTGPTGVFLREHSLWHQCVVCVLRGLCAYSGSRGLTPCPDSAPTRCKLLFQNAQPRWHSSANTLWLQRRVSPSKYKLEEMANSIF